MRRQERFIVLQWEPEARFQHSFPVLPWEQEARGGLVSDVAIAIIFLSNYNFYFGTSSMLDQNYLMVRWDGQKYDLWRVILRHGLVMCVKFSTLASLELSDLWSVQVGYAGPLTWVVFFALQHCFMNDKHTRTFITSRIFFLKKILLRENIEYNNIATHTDELLDPFQMTSVGVPYHRGVD